MSNELVVIENLELVPFFTKGDHVDDVLKAIEVEAMSFVAGDLSVKKNRDAVKAMVTKVTKSKTYLESNGKDLAAEYKAIPKQIDANRKKTKDFLTDLQAKVRKPLTDWEEEQKVIAAERAKKEIIAEIDKDFEFAVMLMEKDFSDREAAAKAESDRLAKEQEERDAKIAADAKEKAEQEAKEKQERLEREKEQLVIDGLHGEALLINRDIDDKAKAIKDAADKEAAAKQAKIDSDAAAEKARKDELERQEREAKRIADEKAKREADREHAGFIHRQMVAALTQNGCGENAKQVVELIAKGLIPNCQINY